MDSLITSGYCKGTERWSASLTSTARCFMYSPKSNAPSAAAGRATKVSAVLCTCSEQRLGQPLALHARSQGQLLLGVLPQWV